MRTLDYTGDEINNKGLKAFQELVEVEEPTDSLSVGKYITCWKTQYEKDSKESKPNQIWLTANGLVHWRKWILQADIWCT